MRCRATGTGVEAPPPPAAHAAPPKDARAKRPRCRSSSGGAATATAAADAAGAAPRVPPPPLLLQVLSVDSARHGVCDFLTDADAVALRTVHPLAAAAVAAHAWSHATRAVRAQTKKGDVSHMPRRWRACFPRARVFVLSTTRMKSSDYAAKKVLSSALAAVAGVETLRVTATAPPFYRVGGAPATEWQRALFAAPTWQRLRILKAYDAPWLEARMLEPLTQLRELRVKDAAVTEALLAAQTQLECLAVRRSYNSSVDDAHHSTSLLRGVVASGCPLQELHICLPNAASCAALTPLTRLHTLFLEVDGYHVDGPATVAAEPFLAYMPRLRRLGLTGWRRGIVRVLSHAAPSLEDLRLDDVHNEYDADDEGDGRDDVDMEAILASMSAKGVRLCALALISMRCKSGPREILEAAPSLAHFSCYNVTFSSFEVAEDKAAAPPARAANVSFPLLQHLWLQSICLGACGASNVFAVLRAAPNLRVAMLQCRWRDAHDGAALAAALPSSLRVLVLGSRVSLPPLFTRRFFAQRAHDFAAVPPPPLPRTRAWHSALRILCGVQPEARDTALWLPRRNIKLVVESSAAVFDCTATFDGAPLPAASIRAPERVAAAACEPLHVVLREDVIDRGVMDGFVEVVAELPCAAAAALRRAALPLCERVSAAHNDTLLLHQPCLRFRGLEKPRDKAAQETPRIELGYRGCDVSGGARRLPERWDADYFNDSAWCISKLPSIMRDPKVWTDEQAAAERKWCQAVAAQHVWNHTQPHTRVWLNNVSIRTEVMRVAGAPAAPAASCAT